MSEALKLATSMGGLLLDKRFTVECGRKIGTDTMAMNTGTGLTECLIPRPYEIAVPNRRPTLDAGHSWQSIGRMFESPNAVQIRISLDGIEPEIWRRLVLPADWNLEQLHLAIQAAFNWWNYHLHEFRIGGLRYGDVAVLTEDSSDESPRVFDFRRVRLRDFGPGSAFTYVYDFGDDWHHMVEIEAFVVLDAHPKHGSCVDGARARPPEDVGGPLGYERFLAILADQEDLEHAEMKRWCGGHFDPEWFDLSITDKDVRNALRPNVRWRPYQPKPKRANH